MGAPRKTIDQYKTQAAVIHNGKYSYDMWLELGQYHDKITIMCPNHGEFIQSLSNHITNRAGCPSCRLDKRSAGFNKKPVDYFIHKAKKVHNNKYNYSLWVPVQNTSTDLVTIGCPEHGNFFQTPASHIDKGAGCPKCKSANVTRTSLSLYGVQHPNQRHLEEAVWARLRSADWLIQEHTVNKRTLEDIASELGVQDTTVGKYCKLHNIHVSRFPVSMSEKQVGEYIRALGVGANLSDRSVIPPQELDIYTPAAKVAIEMCGLYWHGDLYKGVSYHKDKQELCKAKGIRLLTIFEDEWKTRQFQVERKIARMLGVSTEPTVFARQCEVVTVSRKEKTAFLNYNHIQGNGPGSVTYGLKYAGSLVAVMTFIHHSTAHILNRYATSQSVPGGFSKLLSHFKKYNTWSSIETFADLRWSTGELYRTVGFTFAYTIPPDYYWTNGKERFHKFGFRHARLKSKFAAYDATLTENENCRNNGLWKIYDCGKMKYIMENHNAS